MTRLVAIMAVHLGLNLVGLHGLAALLPFFIAEWSLSAGQAGWLSGIPYLLSILAILVGIGTDRFDARILVIAGSLANAIGFLGFALFADGFWSGLVFRAIQGIGFAWIYMPGAKVISDRGGRDGAPGAVGFYISSFPIVASFSFICVDALAALAGWRVAFAVPGATALVSALVVWILVEPRPVGGGSLASLDLRPVFANRQATRLIVANFCHSFELLAVRGWMVTLFAFAATRESGAPEWNWPLLATVLTLIGAPMSMIGTWFGSRVGMARISAVALFLSGAASCLVGVAADWPFWLFFLGPVLAQNLFVLLDSGALGGGVIEETRRDVRGRAMAVLAFANVTGSFAGPVLFGTVLEAAGGTSSPGAWSVAYGVVGAVAVAGGIVALGAARR
ncbi:MAG: MFS transporter [Alphaproteobacteria bacterium]|nr:MFS transporter [Alphaproteobacteria bacterium]